MQIMKKHLIPRPLRSSVRRLLLAIAAISLTAISASAAPAPSVSVIRVPSGGIQPQATTGKDGKLHLLYFKGEAARGDLFYVRSNDGGATFSTPIRVNSQEGSAVAAGTIRGGQIALGRQPNLADVAHALVRDGVWPQEAGVEDEAAGMAYLLRQHPSRYNPLSVAEVAAVAHAGGGVAVLAHPGREKSVYAIPAAAADIAALVAAGLDGLEVYYPTHSAAQTAFYRAQAEQHGLLITAGNDSHGPQNPLGQYPASACAAFLRRMGVELA